MKFIELTNSKRLAGVDDVDIERVILLDTGWCVKMLKGKPNAIVSTKTFSWNNNQHIRLSRFIMNCADSNYPFIDHINGNIFDDRKCNLRFATCAQNSANRGKQLNNTSGEKNICWHKIKKKFEVYIGLNSKTKYVGCFSVLEEAIKARNKALVELHGNFANFG